jgi:hypothetical protein
MGSVFTIYLPPYCLRGGTCPILPNPPFQPRLPLLGLVRHQRQFFSARQNVHSLGQQEDAAKGRKMEVMYVSARKPCILVMREAIGGDARESAYSVPTCREYAAVR